jgi:hypothetical protein
MPARLAPEHNAPVTFGLLVHQFCLELAFGVLVALAFVPRAPVGVLFYRVMGTCAVVPILVAIALPLARGDLVASDPRVMTSALAALCYPIYSGPVRGTVWACGLATAIAGTAAGVVLALDHATMLGHWELTIATSSALSTGLVAGSVALAMVLGHWYLTVPNLSIAHLRRLNGVCIATQLVSIGAIAASCWVFRSSIEGERGMLDSPLGWLHLGTRVAVGLALPLLFAFMTASSLRYQNTRSATGILYASTVLVLIGTAVSVSLQSSYGVPL